MPSRGRVCMDQFVVDVGDDTAAGRRRGRALRSGRRRASRPRRSGPRRCGTITYEIVTRIGGRFARRYVDARNRRTTARSRSPSAAGDRRRRGSAPVSPRPAPPVVRRSPRPARVIGPRREGDADAARLAARRRCTSSPTTASTCYAEIDEVDPRRRATAGSRDGRPDRRLRPRLRAAPRLLALPARRATAARSRTVFYDQRSHGRSAVAREENATIEQLGQRPAAGPRRSSPRGPVVLVGHSMGGMTIVALAEQHPELFGDRVVGVGLISTTAGGLRRPPGSWSRCCPRPGRPTLVERAVCSPRQRRPAPRAGPRRRLRGRPDA